MYFPRLYIKRVVELSRTVEKALQDLKTVQFCMLVFPTRLYDGVFRSCSRIPSSSRAWQSGASPCILKMSSVRCHPFRVVLTWAEGIICIIRTDKTRTCRMQATVGRPWLGRACDLERMALIQSVLLNLDFSLMSLKFRIKGWTFPQ